MKEVGKVTHYFGKIGVAIIELSGALNVGDMIKVEGGKTELNQEVTSMQVEHDQVQSAKKGDVVGLKISEKVREGALVYKIE